MLDEFDNFNTGEEAQKNTVTTEELDAAVKKMRELRLAYDEKKEISTAAYEQLTDQEIHVLSLLQKAGKKKYFVEGAGTVTIASRMAVSAPRDLEAKKAMIDYFMSQGNDLAANYLTVNYQSLNSFYKQKLEEASEKGETFEIPGVGIPTENEYINFRKS